MKNIKTSTICTLISMTSVLVMFIWGYTAGTFEQSWLAIMAGGILSGAVYMIRRDFESAAKDENTEEKNTNKTE